MHNQSTAQAVLFLVLQGNNVALLGYTSKVQCC